MEHTHSPDAGVHVGEQLAAVTNGIVKLFRDYYGRGPTKAKSYILDDRIVVCVLEDTMTRVEKTLVDNGHGHKVREVRLTFQEAMAHEFKQTVRDNMHRDVVAYHSQLTLDPDLGFEFFVLGD
ncbi:MAG: Na-translocating system protein MpsC family protein [Thermoleophilaceae bacterium]